MHRRRVVGEVGSSCVKTVSGAAASSWRSTGTTIWHVSHSCFTTTTSPSGSAADDRVDDVMMCERTRGPSRDSRCDRRHVAQACRNTTLGRRNVRASGAHRTQLPHVDGMRVTFHGVRGRRRATATRSLRYGGNTSCVSVDVPGHEAGAVRPRHRAALLRPDAVGRRAVPRHVPAEPSALGPHPGPAVLQAAAARRRRRRHLRAGAGGRPLRSSRSSPTRSSRRCSRSTSRCSPA